MDYTGNVRYRVNLFGTLVVEVEYRYEYSPSAFNEPDDVEHHTRWKAADKEDLAAIGNIIPVV